MLSRELSIIDTVCIDDDETLLRLPKNMGQDRTWHAARINEITQDVAWSDAWQLVDVAHENQPARMGQGPQDSHEQLRVQHGCLIHHQHVCLEFLVFAIMKTAVGLVLQESMHSLGGMACGLRHPFGSPTGGCRLFDLQAQFLEGEHDRLGNGGLTSTRTACYDKHLVTARLENSLALFVGKRESESFLHTRQGLFNFLPTDRCRMADKLI